VREIELAVQAAVDPYFRGDIFLGLSDLEKVSIEQAYLTATALPAGLEARLGRYLMPVGKQNTTHRHDLHTVEYPYVIQSFLSPDGLKGTGLWVSKIFAPLGFYQELQVTAVDRFGEDSDSLFTQDPVNKQLSGLGFSARFRNYWDISEAANIELSASAITGKRAQPLICAAADVLSPCAVEDGRSLGVSARQSVVGADFTYRWRPLQQGLYKSLIVQAEFMRQINQGNPDLPTVAGETVEFLGPQRGFSGFRSSSPAWLRARPSRAASVRGSWPAVPQSTVTSSRAPWRARTRMASTLGPYPSVMRSGMWITNGTSQARRNSARSAALQAPSTS
jgi:hypothetical protein